MRGRPRKFDEQQALAKAMAVFWQKGLSATSLDDLATGMNMNRPSIYNAFGSKEDIFRKSLVFFSRQLDEALEHILEKSKNAHSDFTTFFEQAIKVYCGDTPAMGCMITCTAPGESLAHPEVKKEWEQIIQRIDTGFCQRLQRAKTQEPALTELDPEMAAKLLHGLLQTIGLRSRLGDSSADLLALARYGISNILS